MAYQPSTAFSIRLTRHQEGKKAPGYQHVYTLTELGDAGEKETDGSIEFPVVRALAGAAIQRKTR